MNSFSVKSSTQLNTFVNYFGKKLIENWGENNNEYKEKIDSDIEFQNFVNIECSKIMKDKPIKTNTFLEIGSTNKKDFRMLGKRDKKHNIVYVMPPNQPIYINFKNKKIFAILIEIGNPVEGCPYPKIYKELHLKTSLNESEMVELFSEASNYCEKIISSENGNIDDKIRISIFEEGYWETLNYKPYRSFDTICLPKKDLNNIINDIKHFMDEQTENRYNKLGIPFKRNYLLEGLPGTGKSSLIHSIASELNHDICVLTFHSKINDITMMRALRSIDDKNILVLEDIDSLFVERKKHDEDKNRISFSGLLNCLDGLGHKHGLITIMTTNYKTNLDSALIRPGRIDYMMKFDYATKEQIKMMFYNFMNLNEENDENNYFNKFYTSFRKLSLSITTSLLQQYLFIYLDKPVKAIENINDLKVLRDKSFDKNQEKNLYL